jgi:hypothetical protein
MISSFVPSAWRDDICLTGSTSDYDQAAYDKYVKKVHDTRIAVPVVMSLICFALIMGGIAACSNQDGEVGGPLIVFAIILFLITIVPVYTAL